MNGSQLSFNFSIELDLLPNILAINSSNEYYKYPIEYLLIISPPDSIKNDVRRYKNYLANIIGNYRSRYSIAHLSLLSFYMYMNVEGERILLRRLQDIAAEQASVKFTLNNFKTFQNSSSLYMEIIEKELFSRISKNFNKKSLFSDLSILWKQQTYIPHLTIGKNLNYNLDLTCNIFRNQNYTQTFIADAVLLLKRNSQGRYEPLQEFPFLSKLSAQQEFTWNANVYKPNSTIKTCRNIPF